MTNQSTLEKANDTIENIDDFVKPLFGEGDLSYNQLAIINTILDDITYSVKLGIKRLESEDIDEE